MAEIRHIVWDWNGTLLDDTALTVRAAETALAAIGHPVKVSIEQWRAVATRPAQVTYEHLIGAPLSHEQWCVLADAWLDAYQSQLPSVALNVEAVAVLQEARRRGITQSIVSLQSPSALCPHVAALGIADLFTAVSGLGGDWSARPTKAETIRAQLSEVGVPAQQALMIGDMADDGREGSQVGLSVALVPTGDTSLERLVASGFPVAPSLQAAVASAFAG
ncbi:MAG: HAD hydrolase-like protein [Propionibacteriaceae bacterium]|jgi:phosphoglycolate phosphatase-like HAD superfamily hydrolase|nr:HAD hydrolase-like protein [Propionibacteriaceae bacterium]